MHWQEIFAHGNDPVAIYGRILDASPDKASF